MSGIRSTGDDWESVKQACSCGWSGTLGEGTKELFDGFVRITCPECDARLELLPFETWKEAEARIDELAPIDRRRVLSHKARMEMWEQEKLTTSSTLPDLNGDAIVVEWDLVEEPEDIYTVLRVDGVELWREPAFWEGYERFSEVAWILKRRYRDRLFDLVPTKRSGLYLYGDRGVASSAVSKTRDRLQDGCRANRDPE